jgi:hypothetical protein
MALKPSQIHLSSEELHQVADFEEVIDCELQNSFSSHFSTQHKTPQFSVIYQKSVSFQTIIVS